MKPWMLAAVGTAALGIGMWASQLREQQITAPVRAEVAECRRQTLYLLDSMIADYRSNQEPERALYYVGVRQTIAEGAD